uniref:Uncharacterized protein n=1 Tax=Rhipicephalus zambeziensis TaxID=60191 RepID=A0A224YG73_9ACAR
MMKPIEDTVLLVALNHVMARIMFSPLLLPSAPCAYYMRLSVPTEHLCAELRCGAHLCRMDSKCQVKVCVKVCVILSSGTN